MRSEQFGAVHFTYRPTVNQYPMYVASATYFTEIYERGTVRQKWLATIGACLWFIICFVNARVFLYWRTKNMEVKLYETINKIVELGSCSRYGF